MAARDFMPFITGSGGPRVLSGFDSMTLKVIVSPLMLSNVTSHGLTAVSAMPSGSVSPAAKIDELRSATDAMRPLTI